MSRSTVRARRALLPLAVTASLALTATPALAAPDDAPSPDTAPVTTPDAPPAESDRMIVKFRDTNRSTESKDRVVEAAARDALGSQAAAPEVDEHVKQTAARADVVKLDRELDEREQQKITAELRKDPLVEYAEPDRLASAAWLPNDTYMRSAQWALNPAQSGIDFPGAWDRSRGAGQTIAVLDTGITSHGDLNAKVVPGRDFISDPQISRDGNGRDANPRDEGDWSGAGECTPAARNSSWHGTHVAGLAAAVTHNGAGIAGAAPAAKLQPVRVLGKCTHGWVSDIADAVSWSSGAPVAGQPANSNPATVINLSLNYPGTCGPTLQSAINTAVSRRVPVLAAAGNNGVNAAGTSPATCENTIVVGASTPQRTTASYSNIGPMVDVLAPGGTASQPLLSTVNAGTTTPGAATYGNQYGTSMATPLVAGTVALMRAQNASLTPARIEQVLKSTSTGPLGTRVVNPAAAVRAVSPAASSTGGQKVAGYTVSGGIGTTWRATGGAAKWGNPVMNEANAANGGRYQEFVRAGKKVTIYWHRSTGAHVLENTTVIGRKFIAAGRERGYGFPSTEERRVPGGAYQVYRNGSAKTKVMWTPRTGAKAVKETGGIGRAYQKAGFERGWGWPATDEYRWGGEVRQRFTGGVTAHWTSARGTWITRP